MVNGCKWSDSAEIHLSVYHEYIQSGELPDDIDIIVGLSRTMYEIGSYDYAIKVGSDAIEWNRSLAGVHKYVALAQKALGSIDDAKETISSRNNLEQRSSALIFDLEGNFK